MKSPTKLHPWMAAALTGALWLAGCSSLPSGPSPGSFGDPDPDFVRVATAPAGTFSSGRTGSTSQSAKIDGTRGGTVSCDRYKVVVPPGAYKGTATITISVPDVTVLKCNLSISPAGANNFAVPVSLVTDCKNTNVVDISTVMQVWFDAAAGVWREVPGTTVDAASYLVFAPLWHFSEYAVAFQTKAGW